MLKYKLDSPLEWGHNSFETMNMKDKFDRDHTSQRIVTDILSLPPPPAAASRPAKCTMDELKKVRAQLIPQGCVHQLLFNVPFMQLCSLTVATKCPKATWLDDYYLDLQKTYSATRETPRSFLGISVGCNKGFDAINTLRMGTFDDTINKTAWKHAMTADEKELHSAVCNQDSASDIFEILPPYTSNSSKTILHPQGEMHCIEPLPITFKKLNHSGNILKYTEKGFHVTHAAISKDSGEMLFPSGKNQKGGVENLGLASCKNRKDCEHVPVYSLADYIETKVKARKGSAINVLSIDVEGFDGDVLLGATPEVLQRVEYLEFEYNWMGSWKEQHLYDIVDMLDKQGDFTCYFAGIDRLWRLTDCWMSYFDIHSWANVACVNRRRVPRLASIMEQVFNRTLDDTTVWKNNKSTNHLRKYAKHALMSVNEDLLRSKYIPNE